MLHRRDQLRPVENVYVQMVRALSEIPVQHIRQIYGTIEKVLEIPSLQYS